MERDHQKIDQKESPTLLLTHANAKDESSPRLKRDEWSEGAVSSLLEVYETKWALRNRAKLKGQDWEDVARHVSSRGCSTNKSPKTPTQCKNKIESMKKRYRAECGARGDGEGSSWPLFSRIHGLLGGPTGNGGGGCPLPPPPPPSVQPLPPPPGGSTKNQSLALVEVLTEDQPQPPLTTETTQNSLHSVGPEQLAKEERPHENEAKRSEQVSDGAKSPTAMDTDSSTPALYGCKDRNSKLNTKMKLVMEKRKRRRISSGRDSDMVIAESIRWLAEAVVKTEQVRMETTREMEKMRAEAEAKRAEIDLKRTEIIANTQLEIARIFASSDGRSAGSSVLTKKN